jgi:hypothetical protein
MRFLERYLTLQTEGVGKFETLKDLQELFFSLLIKYIKARIFFDASVPIRTHLDGIVGTSATPKYQTLTSTYSKINACEFVIPYTLNISEDARYDIACQDSDSARLYGS